MKLTGAGSSKRHRQIVTSPASGGGGPRSGPVGAEQHSQQAQYAWRSRNDGAGATATAAIDRCGAGALAIAAPKSVGSTVSATISDTALHRRFYLPRSAIDHRG